MQLADPSTDDAFARFSSLLASSGVRTALVYLLGLTDFRHIGIFRVDGDRASAFVYVDRDNPEVQQVDDVPLAASYCCFVRDARGVFTTGDAQLDPRLQGHLAQSRVVSYCGVPVMDSAGMVLGSLCHYDAVPRDPGQIDMALMMRVASALAYGDHVPPSPQPRPGRTN